MLWRTHKGGPAQSKCFPEPGSCSSKSVAGLACDKSVAGISLLSSWAVTSLLRCRAGDRPLFLQFTLAISRTGSLE